MSELAGLVIRPLDGPSVELGIGEDGRWVSATSGRGRAGTEVDGSRWWALVGLADCHAHLGGDDLANMNGPHGGDDLGHVRRNAWAQLEGGVFLVADKGGKNEVTLRLLEDPHERRPDLWAAGRVITGPGGYYPDFGDEVDEAGLVDAVRRATAARGATWVKLIGDWPRKGLGAVPSFGEVALARGVEVAHAAGCRVAIHAAAPRTSSMAVAAGIDSIEHGLFLTTEDVEALGRRGGAWVPTLCAMEGVRDQLGPSSSGGRLFDEGLQNVRDLIAGAPGAGVTVLCGTDLHLHHGEVAREAVRLVDYGLTPEQSTEAISAAAYRYLGQTERGFRIGLPADVVFFDRHPHEDISVLTRPVMALRHGRIVVDNR